jgi:2-haloalkanoic acid dehalogenase type II
VCGVSFDFYETLVHHRTGLGRGRSYVDWLATAGLSADPWEHQVLYDVFEYYAAAYRPSLTPEEKKKFWTEFTRRLFDRTGVRGPGAADFARHAAIRELMGPACFAVFDDVLPALDKLKASGRRLAIISDWQKGLAHFCEELGLAPYFDAIVVSAEVGYEKPDPRVFEVAAARLGLPAGEILHVGDHLVDVEGARAAGFAAALLARSGDPDVTSLPALAGVPVLRSLTDLLPFA